MTTPAWRPPTNAPTYDDFDAHGYESFGELSPGERICSPIARSGGKATLRGAFLLLIAFGSGWALLGDRVTWPEWPGVATPAVSPSTDNGGLEPSESTTAPLTNAELTANPAALDDLPSPSVPPGPTAIDPSEPARSMEPPVTIAAVPEVATPTDVPSAGPLPAPHADPADPYQVRALAVGLHPGLSPALLARLSPTDYKNAGIAIQTALAETPESAVFVWPRQRKPELALFRVHFVPGAAPDCRRYVVTVAKDGWSTTALPMEKCETQPRRARRG